MPAQIGTPPKRGRPLTRAVEDSVAIRLYGGLAPVARPGVRVSCEPCSGLGCAYRSSPCGSPKRRLRCRLVADAGRQVSVIYVSAVDDQVVALDELPFTSGEEEDYLSDLARLAETPHWHFGK